MQGLVGDVVDEKIAYDWIHDWRKRGKPKPQIVGDRYEHTTRGFGKRPNDAHSFCPGFQMVKINFELVAVDDLLRGPGDWDAGTCSRHNHQIAIMPALQKSDIAVMRQKFWPQFQVRCSFEDHHLRRLHMDRVYSVHGMASVRWKPARSAMLRNFRGTMDSSPKSIFVKEKNCPPSVREQAMAGGNESAYSESEGRVRTLTLDSDGRVELAGIS